MNPEKTENAEKIDKNDDDDDIEEEEKTVE
jgi:hypothetical protein